MSDGVFITCVCIHIDLSVCLSAKHLISQRILMKLSDLDVHLQLIQPIQDGRHSYSTLANTRMPTTWCCIEY